MSNKSYVNAQIGFVDLATFDPTAAFLYGGNEAISYFLRTIIKGNWFTYVPVALRHTGQQDYGSEFNASFHRSADYVINVWLRVQVPKIQIQNLAAIYSDASIRYTRKFMHNLISKVTLTFNDLTVNDIDSHWLDVNEAYRNATKSVVYRNLIGDISSMTSAVGPNVALGTDDALDCPLPVYFADDTGVALMVASLPFNDIRLNYTLAAASDLIVIEPGTAAGDGGAGSRVATFDDVHLVGQAVTVKPKLSVVETWAHYALVHNDERAKMGKGARDLVVNQISTVTDVTFDAATAGYQFSQDLRVSGQIWGIFWNVLNTTTKGEGSNYTTEPNYAGVDPIAESHLLYENQYRFSMGSDYTSLLAPFFFAPAAPTETGYHSYFYTLEAWSKDPKGSSGYGMLSNVSVRHDPSTAAFNAAQAAPTRSDGTSLTDQAGVVLPQKFKCKHKLAGYQILRAERGSMGFPVY